MEEFLKKIKKPTVVKVSSGSQWLVTPMGGGTVSVPGPSGGSTPPEPDPWGSKMKKGKKKKKYL